MKQQPVLYFNDSNLKTLKEIQERQYSLQVTHSHGKNLNILKIKFQAWKGHGKGVKSGKFVEMKSFVEVFS